MAATGQSVLPFLLSVAVASSQGQTGVYAMSPTGSLAPAGSQSTGGSSGTTLLVSAAAECSLSSPSRHDHPTSWHRAAARPGQPCRHLLRQAVLVVQSPADMPGCA